MHPQTPMRQKNQQETILRLQQDPETVILNN